MKLNYALSKLSLQDIDGIYKYAKANWSSAQADKYYEIILSEVNNICINPELGESTSDVKDNHKKIKVKFHFIVYELSDQTIYVDRILHQRMDLENILDL